MDHWLREPYLQNVVEELRGDFLEQGVTIPLLHISVGMVGQGKTIALTYAKRHSPDGLNQVYISPTINNTDHVIHVVAHELVHVALDCKGGHGPNFSKLAKRIGLVSPYSFSVAGPQLGRRAQEIKKKWGEYPHPGFTY